MLQLNELLNLEIIDILNHDKAAKVEKTLRLLKDAINLKFTAQETNRPVAIIHDN